MSAGNVFFALMSVLCLVGAIVTVGAQKPVRAAMGLLTTIFGIAGLFLLLKAEFLAAIQLIVYAGAVVVLFVFVIMLIGADVSTSRPAEGGLRLSRVLGPGVAVGLSLAMLWALSESDLVLHEFREARPEHGSIEAVGGLLFSKGIVPFELATALLIVAVIGAIAVARTVAGRKTPRFEQNPTKRMFHGPIDPRDGGPARKPPLLAKEPAE